MPKGAKTGDNRFKSYQRKKSQYRTDRIKSVVVPRLKTLVGKTSFTGKTSFSKVCAELYNEGLSINEKPIGYRTFEQNTVYWRIVGELYYSHWGVDESTISQTQGLRGKIAIKQEKKLRDQLDKVLKENQALKEALRDHGANENSTSLKLRPLNNDSEFRDKFDKTCRALNLIIKASDGMFEVDIDESKIKCTFNILESDEGLVPKSLAAPYVMWWIEKKDKTEIK